MQSKLDSQRLLVAAVGGLLLGAACKGAPPSPSETVQSAAAPLASAGAAKAGEKACCKGLNDCKGKGGCVVPGKHDCAGQNSCKGQGGCDMRCKR